jgi:hypothetical protein
MFGLASSYRYKSTYARTNERKVLTIIKLVDDEHCLPLGLGVIEDRSKKTCHGVDAFDLGLFINNSLLGPHIS